MNSFTFSYTKTTDNQGTRKEEYKMECPQEYGSALLNRLGSPMNFPAAMNQMANTSSNNLMATNQMALQSSDLDQQEKISVSGNNNSMFIIRIACDGNKPVCPPKFR